MIRRLRRLRRLRFFNTNLFLHRSNNIEKIQINQINQGKFGIRIFQHIKL